MKVCLWPYNFTLVPLGMWLLSWLLTSEPVSYFITWCHSFGELLQAKADVFITNDERLKRSRDIEVLCLKDYVSNALDVFLG